MNGMKERPIPRMVSGVQRKEHQLTRRRCIVTFNSIYVVLITGFIVYCRVLFSAINKIAPDIFPKLTRSNPNPNPNPNFNYTSISEGRSNVAHIKTIDSVKNSAVLSSKGRNQDGVDVVISNSSNVHSQKIFVIPSDLPPSEATGEYQHFITDGIDLSSRMERTFDPYDKESIWVVDLTKTACNRDVVQMVQDRWDYMLNETISVDNHTNGEEDSKRGVVSTHLRPEPWKIFFLDFGDDFYRGTTQCGKAINNIFNSTEKYVHLASRQTRVYRKIVHEKGEDSSAVFKSFGKPRNMHHLRNIFYGSPRILRYGVRGDLVNLIEEIFEERKKSLGGSLDIVLMPRPKDVIHFWNHDSAQKSTASHRTFISKRLNQFSRVGGNRNHTIHTALIGEARAEGRKTVQRSYAEALLEYKIVVVCQRDKWEDHYRLMEGLAGGALVMTDPMHPLPYGIKHGEQVIVYQSMMELQKYIIYYFRHAQERKKIAKSGYEVAMREHRSDAWMERMIFGNWSTSDGVSAEKEWRD